MRDPASDSRYHKQHWKHICGETHCSVNNSSIKIDVRIEFSFAEVGVCQRNLLKLNGDFYKRLFTGDFKHLESNALNDFGSGVIVFVDSVAESAKHPFF